MQDLVDHLRATLPSLPDESIQSLSGSREYGITSKDASTLLLLDDGDRLDYYYSVVQHLRSTFSTNSEILARVGKSAGNW
jgi:aspartyl-tRNA(Asn)/glutamyl-tRNA(Gln) amidotransferase subunit B